MPRPESGVGCLIWQCDRPGESIDRATLPMAPRGPNSLTYSLSLNHSLPPSLFLGGVPLSLDAVAAVSAITASLSRSHTRAYTLSHSNAHTQSHSLTHSLSLSLDWMRLQPCRARRPHPTLHQPSKCKQITVFEAPGFHCSPPDFGGL